MTTTPRFGSRSARALRIGALLLLPLSGLSALTACGGGGGGEAGHGDGHGDAHAKQGEAEGDKEMVPVEGIPMSCEAGTQHQQAETSEGVEHWCDRNGTMHGPFLRMFKNGERKTEGTYFNNLPDGTWIWWHESGKESQKGKYVKGKKTGSWTSWYASGARMEEGDYLQGRKQGTWTKWYESGKKMESGMYHNGMKSSVWTYYDEDEENTAMRTERYENGKMVEEKDLAKGKKK
jgi:hypothetical protein